MRDLPSGTVTFVFTDIEGSTRLLRELGDAYAGVLAEQRHVLRTAFAAHGGIEVDTQGDAFFYVFREANDAVAGARAAQAALSRGPIRVRIGLHTGEPVRTDEGYVGLDVHRGARIAAAGHGGQVVLSRATRELIDDSDVRDLGQHRVKDFDEPVWLFQLGDRPFPPLKTIANTNLPRRASTFVGREREMSDIGRLLREHRFVTLIGPGGSGKTRLAIEVAAETVGDFIHGVFWVELAAITDPTLVIPAVGQAIGAHGDLTAEIGDKHVMVLLDNLEQVIDAAPAVAALVEACPNLSVVVTSRERLRVRGEVGYDVEPLGNKDAVELFCTRGQVARSAAVAELCRQLDNMPLAVELAAARASVLSPDQILERLGMRLDLFKGGRDADPRQASLRATIEWSHDLLASAEQKAFAGLAVFAGGCVIEAAENVCAADLDTLQTLVDKSLLRHTGERFWMLETIREYALERLALDEQWPTIRRAHAKWMSGFAGRLNVRHEDQDEALSRLRSEMPNIRLALEQMRADRVTTDRLALATALAQPMFQLGAALESREWLEDALAACEECPVELISKALLSVSLQSTLTGDAQAGERYAAKAAELASGTTDRELISDVYLASGVAEQARGNLDAAERFTSQALAIAEELGDRWRIGELRNNLSYIALIAGNLALARNAAEAALPDALARRDYHIAAMLLHNLCMVAIKAGATADAAGNLDEALRICRSHGLDSVLTNCLEAAAALAQQLGDHQLAATLLGATDNASRNFGVVEDEIRLATASGAKAALGEEEFEELVAIGAGLDIDGASTRAQDWLDSVRGTR